MSKQSSVRRWSAQRKQEVVLRLLRGESLDALSRATLPTRQVRKSGCHLITCQNPHPVPADPLGQTFNGHEFLLRYSARFVLRKHMMRLGRFNYLTISPRTDS